MAIPALRDGRGQHQYQPNRQHLETANSLKQGCIAGNKEQLMGRSQGWLTSKIHAVVGSKGLPVQPCGGRGSRQGRPWYFAEVN
jgi:hypothetical protein